MSAFPIFVVKAFYRKDRPYYDHKQTVLRFHSEEEARSVAASITDADSVHIQVRDSQDTKWRHLTT
jgi:hypothetical protein